MYNKAGQLLCRRLTSRIRKQQALQCDVSICRRLAGGCAAIAASPARTVLYRARGRVCHFVYTSRHVVYTAVPVERGETCSSRRVTSHPPALRVVPSSTRHNSTNIDRIQKATKDIESCELGAYSRSFLHSVVTIRYAVCASRLVAVRPIRSEQTFWAEYKYIEVCFHATSDHVELKISAPPPPGTVGQAARHLRPSSCATSASA